MARVFVVYELWNPIKNQVFYVGKTYLKSYRLQDHLYEAECYRKKELRKDIRNKHKCRTINKIIDMGLTVEYKEVFYTQVENDALEEERRLILKYGKRINKTGILTNLTDGGDGTVGYVAPAWLKKKFSKQRMGHLNPMFGKHHKISSKLDISNTRKYNILIGKIKPYKHSDQHKELLRIDNKGAKIVSKEIAQICPINGNIIEIFPSVQKAAENVNGLKSNIHSCATKFKHRITCGYYWRFTSDKDIKNNILDIHSLNVLRTKPKIAKRVIQYDSNWNIIKVWESASEVCRSFNKSVSFLSYYLKTEKIFEKCYWQYLSI